MAYFDRRFTSRIPKTRLAAALGILILASSSACKFREADDFNAEAGVLVCQFNRTCGPENSTEDLFEYAEGEACYDDFVEQHLACPDACDYEPAKARKCIRKLERMVESCDIDYRSMRACQDVYDCRSTEDAQLIDECGFEYSAGTCLCDARADGGATPALLALVGLLFLRRRRSLLNPHSKPRRFT